MRILIAAVGTRGDVQPMLALALRARGHVIRFCAPPNFRSWIESHQLPFHSLGRDFHAFLTEMGVGIFRGALALRGDTRRQFEEMASVVGDADLILGASIHSAARGGLGRAQLLDGSSTIGQLDLRRLRSG